MAMAHPFLSDGKENRTLHGQGYVRSPFMVYNNNFIEGASTSNTSFHSKSIDGAL